MRKRQMKPFQISLLFVAIAMTAACKERTGSDSSVQGVFAIDDECQAPTAARLQAVKALIPDGTISGFSDAELAQVMTGLAELPDDYLAWIALQHGAHNFRIVNKDPEDREGTIDAVGLTQWRLTDNGVDVIDLHPILVAGDRTIVLLHEMGHVIQHRQQSTAFDAAQKAVFDKEARNWFVGKYAQTSEIEYFAESFETFYCSPASLNRLAAELPATYTFLKSVLLPPTWAASMPVASTSDAVIPRPMIKSKFKFGATFDDTYTGRGAKILTVSPGKAADRAGLKAGDIITRIEPRNILALSDIDLILSGLESNQLHVYYVTGNPHVGKDIQMLLDVVFRAEDANGTESPDLGACVEFASRNPTCEDYLSQPICNDRWAQNVHKDWYAGTKCVDAPKTPASDDADAP